MIVSHRCDDNAGRTDVVLLRFLLSIYSDDLELMSRATRVQTATKISVGLLIVKGRLKNVYYCIFLQ